jgi:acyl-coenzyme A synthetase/AMP-(fatty) acid ligase
LSPGLPWLLSFRGHASARPDADAVVTDHRRITFRELDLLAGGMQRELMRRAATSPVTAITVNDPVERAAAILAVAASGKAHVLLDPGLDDGALQDAAGRIGATSVIGASDHLGTGLVIDPSEITATALEPVPTAIEAPFAFVSTSGSTGDPKFVMLDHRAAGTRLPAEPSESSEIDRVFRVFNFSGNSVNATIDCLRSGSTLLAVDPRTLPPSRIVEFLSEERATILRMSPSLSRLVLRSATGRSIHLDHVRQIGGGGEPMLWTDVEALRSIVPTTAVVVHGYASTETRSVTRRVITSAEPIGEGAVAAGRPRAGRRIWIDAGDGVPADPGATGNIVIEGIFGTHGPDFETLPDGWLRFRSGDLGELTADGELLHRGRSDRVVKVGAMRIDLSTIEDVLRRAPGVTDVCAVPVPMPGSDPRVVAHVVLDGDSGVDARGLREFALGRLTSAAVPARFELRATPLPLLPSGKKDIRALLQQKDL